jgi:hypothetical protein
MVIHWRTQFTPQQIWRHAHSHRPLVSHHYYSVPLRSIVFKLPLPMAVKWSTNSVAGGHWLHVSWFLFPLIEYNEGAILWDICHFRFGSCYFEFCYVSRWYVGLPSPSSSPILNSLLPLGARVNKIQSTDLFGQNTTYTTISILVWLHVSVLSWTILRPISICEKYYQCTVYIIGSHTVYRMCIKQF